jgi:hypothetical protein
LGLSAQYLASTLTDDEGDNSLLYSSLGWLTQEPTILVGIDTTHPGLSSIPGTPSIVGIVASVDKDFLQFPASLRL